jgi:hypothetical protein
LSTAAKSERAFIWSCLLLHSAGSVRKFAGKECEGCRKGLVPCKVAGSEVERMFDMNWRRAGLE